MVTSLFDSGQAKIEKWNAPDMRGSPRDEVKEERTRKGQTEGNFAGQAHLGDNVVTMFTQEFLNFQVEGVGCLSRRDHQSVQLEHSVR